MSSFTDALREIITKPGSPEIEIEEATASLKRLADAGGEDARQALTELGLLTPPPSTYTVSKMKAVINDPAATPEERESAWIMLKAPEDIPAEVRKLEAELLEEVSSASIAAVTFQDLHEFCTAREWRNPAVASLFQRWLETYFKSEAGSRKLAQLETYKLLHDNPSDRHDSETGIIPFLAEVRRRVRTDEDFCTMLSQGVAKNEIPMDWLTAICSNIWVEQEVSA
jgi:hypothetical protein